MLAALTLLAGCVSAGSDAATGTAKEFAGTPFPAEAVNTQQVACARIPMHNDKLLTQGETGSIPNDFVRPAPGATLFGTLDETSSTFYAASDESNSIISYYRNMLKAQGYTLTPVKEGWAPTHQTFEFSKAGVAGGQIYTRPDETYYIVIYAPQK